MANSTRSIICDERDIWPGTWVAWFPYYERLLQPAVYQCFKILHDKPAENSAPVDVSSIPGCPGAYNLITCVQDALPSQVTLAMAGAQVILGLAPTLISTFSPSVGEISMLSSSRPILSFMLTIGCPAVYIQRSLEYDDPIEILKNPTQALFRQNRVDSVTRSHICISLFEYLVVLVSIINVLTVDGQLGFQTISVWKAGAPYLVYLWSIFALIPHGLSATANYFSKSMRDERRANQYRRQEENSNGHWLARFKRETTICAAKYRRGYLDHKTEEPTWVIWMNIAASFAGFALVMYGTILFSSLLFIGPLDAFGAIMRYIGSTLICRMVLAYELSGMKAAEQAPYNEDSISSQRLLSRRRTNSFKTGLNRINSDDSYDGFVQSPPKTYTQPVYASINRVNSDDTYIESIELPHKPSLP